MLRLRPSELTLTAEDVDETFRRMARKQATKSPRNLTSQSAAQSGRPILRRGPQRAVRDAITTLGEIPILRPQPQEVIHSSADEDVHDDIELRPTGPRERIDSVSDSMLHSHDERTSPTNASTSSALRTLHLPFRLAHEHRAEHSPAVAQHRTEVTPASLEQYSAHLMEPRSDTISDEVLQDNPYTRPATTPNPTGLRGGGPSRRDQLHTSSQDMSSAFSPLHQVPQSPSPHDQEPRYSPNPERTLYLKGYVADPSKHPQGSAYWFRELTPQAPRTEPRRGSGRQAMPTRSLSSGNAPAQRHSPSGSYSDDVFSTPVEREHPPHSGHTPSGTHSKQGLLSATRPRQFSSEASATSGAFSLYELPPESRRPSNERSGPDHGSYTQYDGSAASTHANRGAYRSVHSSQLHDCNCSPTQSSVQSATRGQHSVSPLPSLPYTRAQMNNVSPQEPKTTHTFATTSPSYMDAATAAAQDLPSPLDPYSEHFEHLLHNARQTMPIQPSSYHNSAGDFSTRSHQHGVTVRRNVADAPQAQGMNNVPPQHIVLPLAQDPADSPGVVSGHDLQAARRSVQGTRADHRSSENVPVQPPAQSSGPSRNSQVQIHRAAFERLHHAMQRSSIENMNSAQHGPSRLSLPPPSHPRDTSNRVRAQVVHQTAMVRSQTRRRTSQMSSSPLPSLDHAPTPQANITIRGDMIRASPRVRPSVPPRAGSRWRDSDVSRRYQRGGRRQVTPAILPRVHLQPSRHVPSTALALDHASATTTLRSPLIRAATSARPYRRIPPQQRDQENSGVGEQQLMRQEEAAINARYGEDEQRNTMDETPPRVGRVERRMFS
jgi:hypothetical protein